MLVEEKRLHRSRRCGSNLLKTSTNQPRLFNFESHNFEAARELAVAENVGITNKLHGHTFNAWSFTHQKDFAQTPDLLQVLKPFNYSLLNDIIDNPTDSEIVRFIANEKTKLDTEQTIIGLSPTGRRGCVIDDDLSITAWKRYRFEAAHRLPNVPIDHPCGTMHGHGFEVKISVRDSSKSESALYERIDAGWLPIQQTLHHKCLNLIHGLENPTSEIISQWLWTALAETVSGLDKILVYETKTCGCEFDGRDYRIWKDQTFESSLTDKENTSVLFGHSYLIRLHLMSDLDSVLGWTVDYGDVKKLFAPVYAQLDHKELHAITSLDETDVAGILKWIKRQANESIPELNRLDLFETPSSGASLCWGDSSVPEY